MKDRFTSPSVYATFWSVVVDSFLSSGAEVIEAAPSVSVASVDKPEDLFERTSNGRAGADEPRVVMEPVTESEAASATITLAEAKLEVSRTAITVKLCTNLLFNSFIAWYPACPK